MVPGGEPQQESLGRFAAEVVGLGPDRDESGTLDALFRKLQDRDFLPDPLAHEAILALAGRPIAPGSLLAEAAADADERRLHREVEQYAAGFFDEPVASRVERYRRLGQASAHHPRLIERLRLLRPGLMIDRLAVNDPSPVVQRLVDDLLWLFPLRPEPRAIEARERAERFRSDPELTVAQRGRALKDLARRHPEVVALISDYPAQLAKVRRRTSVDRFRANAATFLASSGRRPHWIIAVILLSGVGRLITPHSSPTTTPSNLRSSSKLPLSATGLDAAVAEAIPRSLRVELKGSIRRELTRIGKSLDEPRLQRVVDVLPVEQLPNLGGMGSIVQAGQWTAPTRDRFVARLKAALKESGLALSDAELDDLAPRCFPEASRR